MYRLNRLTKALTRILELASMFFGTMVPLSVIALVTYLLWRSTALSLQDLSGLLGLVWTPTEAKYGLVPLVVGTVSSGFAAVPLVLGLGLPAALYMGVFADRGKRSVLRMVMGTLAGLPSVVIGLFVLGSLGISLLSAALAIFMLVTPQYVLSVSGLLQQTAPTVVLAARALGLGDLAVIRLVISETLSGVLGTLLVALGRGFGEAVALTFVAGNVATLIPEWLGPIRTLTTTIALELDFAADKHYAVLHVVALLVMVLIATTIALGRWLISRSKSHDS